MKGDFTRDTFDAANHFSRVLTQQGRVTLDADGNEQTAILLHYLRTLARDLIGPYAAPVEHGGFALGASDSGGFTISAGRYYVDGLLVENDAECTYLTQPDYPIPDDDPFRKQASSSKNGVFWIYLDVWERHITFLDEDAIREAALNGPDTCTRSQVVWQVKALGVDAARFQKKPADPTAVGGPLLDSGPEGIPCDEPLDQLIPLSSALLAARVDPGQKMEDPCVTPPSSKYRGTENQLYRVEIHTGGNASQATFKWSRDNGSVAAAWLGSSGNDLQVSSINGFEAGNWVELTSETRDLLGQPGVLVKVTNVQPGLLSVDPNSYDPSSFNLSQVTSLTNPKVRRWDQTQNDALSLLAGAVPVHESSATDPAWIDLEDGIQVQFAPGGEYRSGDYWLIAARVATGSIEWPSASDAQGKVSWELLPPDGMEHHYAPLGFVTWNTDRNFRQSKCRCDFEPLSSCFQLGSIAVGGKLLKPAVTNAPFAVQAPKAKLVSRNRGKH